jgi:hypothetical protein
MLMPKMLITFVMAIGMILAPIYLFIYLFIIYVTPESMTTLVE